MSLHRQQSGSGRSNRTLCRPLHVALDALNGPGAAQLKRTAFWGLESSRRAPSRAAAHVRYKQAVRGLRNRTAPRIESLLVGASAF